MQRSKHSLSRHHLVSMNMGQLVPVFLEEVLPGDSIRHQTSALVRVAPLVTPVMHPVHVHVHSFFVPSRLLWDNWEAFITGRDPNLVVPTVAITMSGGAGFPAKLAQYMGVGADSAAVTVNALPFRAYNLIYNEYYRDQDLNTAALVPTNNGPDTANGNYIVRNCSWEKDYFTTARPNPQQGALTEAVAITLTGDLPVRGIGKNQGTFSQTNTPARETGGVTPTYAFSSSFDGPSTGGSNTWFGEGTAASNGFPNIRVPAGTIVSGGMDINQWRQSMAYQKMREHRNRYGSRYTDMLAYLGISSSDARLQRPEYLGGGKQTISFSEVLSTAETTTAVIGDMAGHGIAALGTRPYKRFFEEHGYVMSLMFVRPVSLYGNRIPRTFLRRDYEHYWQKELEMMGDQIIQNNEIYGDSGTPSGTFGYIPRFDDYRHGEGVIAGEFRTVLNSWHLARMFSSQPVLNGSFVTCDPATRIFASAVNDQLYCMIAHRVAARRLVSKNARN